MSPFTVPLRDIPPHAYGLAGGKAVNLGRLLRGGFPVPDGFVVTTGAYAADGVMPEPVRETILEAYAALGGGPVAVRSSATVEDLTEASFAGQQDTYLNVIGEDALVGAVRDCWASLFTERAVAYRRNQGISDEGLALAVVVQRMVDVRVAGVMFTADPLTGSRNRTSIDANPGLGEAVVSGSVNPDRFVVDTPTGRVLDRRLGDKRLAIVARAGGGVDRVERESDDAPALTDAEVAELTALGGRVTALYGTPQDTEWAIDADGRAWLTQSRPITTLFPLIEPQRPGRHVYLCISLAQGLTRPITPIGRGSFRLITTSICRVTGVPVADRRVGGPAYAEAGQRVYADISTPLRIPVIRRLLKFFFGWMEARSGAALDLVGDDPGLRPTGRPLAFVAPVARLMAATRLPVRAVQGLVDPAYAARKVDEAIDDARAAMAAPEGATGLDRLRVIEDALSTRTFLIMPSVVGYCLGGFAMLALARKLLEGRATGPELQTVLRGLPNNPTTTMDMELWDLAVGLDHDARAALAGSDAAGLARAYAEGTLPAGLRAAIDGFLERWGDRAVAEIDLGMPRWRDDPTQLLGVVKNYVADPSEESGRARFAAAAREAEAMVAELGGRLDGPRAALLAFALDRVRRLTGMRESPKFGLITMFATARRHLQAIGDELVAAGRIAERDDVMMLTYADVEAALHGADVREVVAENRAAYARELRRRHVPRLLLEDGTELEALAVAAVEADGALVGTPASAGTVTGVARVVLDPVGAELEPGEILVCPSTDPGWTPLFLTAGGLVMEMGGSNSHGAVVAREYGIPAVVGVPWATERIATGDRIMVDGVSGVVSAPEG